jgi:hypothetical protein
MLFDEAGEIFRSLFLLSEILIGHAAIEQDVGFSVLDIFQQAVKPSVRPYEPQ